MIKWEKRFDKQRRIYSYHFNLSFFELHASVSEIDKGHYMAKNHPDYIGQWVGFISVPGEMTIDYVTLMKPYRQLKDAQNNVVKMTTEIIEREIKNGQVELEDLKNIE